MAFDPYTKENATTFLKVDSKSREAKSAVIACIDKIMRLDFLSTEYIPEK
jgi:hypothetical protein